MFALFGIVAVIVGAALAIITHYEEEGCPQWIIDRRITRDKLRREANLYIMEKTAYPSINHITDLDEIEQVRQKLRNLGGEISRIPCRASKKAARQVLKNIVSELDKRKKILKRNISFIRPPEDESVNLRKD